MSSKKNIDKSYIIDFDLLENNLAHLELLHDEEFEKALEDLFNELDSLANSEEDLTKLREMQEIYSMIRDIEYKIGEFYLSLRNIKVNIENSGSYERSKSEIKDLKDSVIEAFEYLENAYDLAYKVRDIIESKMKNHKLIRKVDDLIESISIIEDNFEPINFTGKTTNRVGYIGKDGIYF